MRVYEIARFWTPLTALATWGEFSSTCPPLTTRHLRGIKGFARQSLGEVSAHRPWAPPVPLLFTSKVYHGIREKSTGNVAQKIEPKNVQIVHFLKIPLAGGRRREGEKYWEMKILVIIERAARKKLKSVMVW